MARIERRVASASWIDERLWSPALPEVDHGSLGRYTNNTHMRRSVLTGEEAYRFSNFLEAFIEVDAQGRITGNGFTDASKMYRGTSFAELESEVFETRRHVIDTAPDRVQFKQLVGCRTQSPEEIAAAVGMVVGAGIGGVFLGPLGAIAGGWIGHEAGREFIEELLVFPPIWTELSLTIYANGRSQGELLRHSHFPSNCYYLQADASNNNFTRDSIYDARSHKDYWLAHGWGRGNPWNIPQPSGLGDNRTALLQGSAGGTARCTGPVRGSIAVHSGEVHGGARIPGPTGYA